MELTQRARLYLKEIKFVKKWRLTVEEAREHLQLVGIENERICEIASLYSGFHLKVDGEKQLFLNLFSQKDCKKKRIPEVEIKGEKQYYDIGVHKEASIYFAIDESGALYNVSVHKDEAYEYTKISSSIEKYIEYHAYWDTLSDLKKNDSYPKILDLKKFKMYINSYYKKVEECSDEIHYFGRGEYGVINKGLLIGGKDYYCVVYSKSQSNVDFVINELIKQGITE